MWGKLIKCLSTCFNKVLVGNTDDDVEKLLKARYIYESHEQYPKDALHMYAENEHDVKRNEAVLHVLSGDIYTIEAIIQSAQNLKQTNAGVVKVLNKVTKLLKLKIGAKVNCC